MAPGLLFVYMAPKPTLPIAQFHEWYNNEHGPTRLRLPAIFTNGLRYVGNDGLDPPFLAIYDVTSMHWMREPVYTNLRANRSPREAATIGQVAVDRRFYDLVATHAKQGFAPAEQLPSGGALGRILVVEEVEVGGGTSDAAVNNYIQAFSDVRGPLLAKDVGWLRSRLFRTSTVQDDGDSAQDNRFAVLHEYESTNFNPEIEAAKGGGIVSASVRTMKLFYVFGPAPRDLDHLAALPSDSPEFVSADGKSLVTVPGPSGNLQSTVIAPDGLVIPFQLEGNPSPDAPTVAFCNSLLTSLHMWDDFVEILKKERPDLRILRYNHRGRGELPAEVPVSADQLADDLASVLDALRIEKLHVLIGVSLGGVTTLNFAIRHPRRLAKYIACDFNVCGSASNTAAWKERTAIAEADGGNGIKHELAPATVQRWFHPVSMEKTAIVNKMTQMVSQNNLTGFRYGCQALWEYDLKPKMGSCKVPALFIAGDGDAGGKFLTIMKAYEKQVGFDKAEFRSVANTGHLPMTEDAVAFWEAVKDFV
ncbi:3-oxoadipate enol-lactonase 2 [Ceratocystis lukuohia]|uniref:3-oxoadipate enol-lactonase 2 n=1 Tax=Ceratocystis lukuohia TaxID=2019550 RepID=A0ABR4MFI0_9PEZI